MDVNLTRKSGEEQGCPSVTSLETSNKLTKFRLFLKELEASPDKLDEFKIHDKLNNFVKKENILNIIEVTSELLAFLLVENYHEDGKDNVLYFGPMFRMGETDIPDLKEITPEIIACWEKRAQEATNLIFKNRYANLVWEFKLSVTQQKADIKYAWLIIDSSIALADSDIHSYEMSIFSKLERAISIAASINDKKRISTLVNSIISYEDKVAEDSKIGLWGKAYDILMDEKNIRNLLEEKDINKIISGLENRLARLVSQTPKDPWAIEHAAFRLAEHYRRMNKNDETVRVLSYYREAFEDLSEKADSLVSSAWLEGVHKALLKFGMHSEADEVLTKLQQVSKKIHSELKSISVSREIKKEDMDAYIASLLSGSYQEALIRIIINFIPKYDSIVEQIKDLSKTAPMTFMISKKIIDDKGVPCATIRSVEDDLEGNVCHQMSQNMSFASGLFGLVFKEFCSHFSVDANKLIDFLYESPVFDIDRKSFVTKGIEAHFNGDYFVSISLLIPQLEHVVRCFIESCGGNIYKVRSVSKDRYSSRYFTPLNLDDLLRDKCFLEIYKKDIQQYLRVVFTDPRGWNLRNDVCHGDFASGKVDSAVSLRVVHALLCLALARQTKDTDKN
ncbi:MAG: DUF4209 domain-containing protein [bacterium]